ncbi:alpha/beta hydrolase [Lachnoclostridium pacaense]|uniref:alpha/beta hydrolase n=1 Tax=Enterocloster hominis (ex Hitch et al. 2024) TaxID=1917870 RepID=UPI0010304F80|nr:alpha/beta hydrolase [Lachnoclostridium pacaense]MCC2876890.1 alpha/beta hydrolase [Lachnoclostridium pacaense]
MSDNYRIAFVPLPDRVTGLLYEPELLGRKSQIGIVLMHSDESYLGFLPAPELARRGYRVLAATVADAKSTLDDKLLNVKAAVEFLKGYPGIEKVLLLGHSGGATLMSAYQCVAENGVEVFQGPEKLIPCGLIETLPAADGVVFLDSNFGNGAMTLFSLDPAVMEESGGAGRDPGLDLFNMDHGFHPDGAHYSEGFKRRFYKAQGERGNRLIEHAVNRLRDIEEGKGAYSDDEPMVIPGANQIAPNNKLFPQDLSLLSHTKKEWPLLHGDGSITLQVVPSVRVSRPGQQNTGSLRCGGVMTTVKTYLRSQAVRTTEDFRVGEDGVYGIDWDSSYCCPPSNVPGIHVPMLVMGMTGSYEYLASEVIYERAGSTDKTLGFVEGAGHNFTPAYEAETYPGQFGDTVKVLFDFVDSWIDQNGRFI